MPTPVTNHAEARSEEGVFALQLICCFCWGYSAGSDWETIKMMRINATGGPEALPDTLVNVKFSSTGWTPDDKVRTGPRSGMQHHLYVGR